MELPDIRNFEELIEPFSTDKIYRRHEIRRLTAAGDNYASLILAITIHFETPEGEEEELHLAAKLLPPNDFMRQFMNIQFTVRNELGFYQTILPALRHFQKEMKCERNLDAYPHFYNGRLSLTSSQVDNDSIILLENLKTKGYELYGDKNGGLDLDTTKLILSKMAELHGAVIGLRENQPDVFREKLEPFFDEFRIFEMEGNEEFMTCSTVVDGILKIIQSDELCSLHIYQIQDTIKLCLENLSLPKNASKFKKDIFASLINADLWINNIMVRTHLNKITDVKLLDWQLYEYCNVAKDLLFFLTSSTQEDLYKNQFDDLIKFYFDCLIANLKELKCDLTKFTFETFQEEMKNCARSNAYFYVLMALPSIFANSQHTYEVHELSKEKLLGQLDASEVGKSRVCMITKKLIQKGWI